MLQWPEFCGIIATIEFGTNIRGGISEFSFLISQINNILFCNPNFEVKFIKRQTNMVAHTLARAAIA
jgi:hypothetical protein